MKRKLIAQKPAPPAPPFRPLLITALGTNTTPDGAWQIGVTETSLALSHSFKHHRAPGLTVSGWSTISPAEWKAHAGWFVFVESESNVWAYDGDLDLQLNTETTVGNNSTGNTYHSPFPCPVPEVVFSRLSEPVQKRLQNEK